MLEGVYVANLTPFRDDPDRTLDLDAYRRHVAWLAEHGVTGVVPFGTNGEGPSVSAGEKCQVLQALVRDDLGLEIVPAVTQGNLPDTLALLERLNDLPLGGVLVLPPYYYRPADADGLRPWFEAVLEASRHPVLAYHIPTFAVHVPTELVCSMPFWGVKNSSGDLSYSARVRAAGKGVLLGTEEDLVGQLPDAEGAISVLANIVPEHLVGIYERVRAGDVEGARALEAQVQQLRALAGGSFAPGLLKQLTEARNGIPMGTVRPPLTPVPATFDARSALHDLAVAPA